MARRHSRPPLGDRRARHPAVGRLAGGRSGADDVGRRRWLAPGPRRRRLDRPDPLFQRVGNAVSQSVAGPRQVPGRDHRRAARRARGDRRAARSTGLPDLRAPAPDRRRRLPTVPAEGADPPPGWRPARALCPGLRAPLPADADRRHRGARAPQAPAVHGRRHPLCHGPRGRRRPARLQDRAAGGRAGPGVFPRAAGRRRRLQRQAYLGDRHRDHLGAAGGDGAEAPEPLGVVLRPASGRFDDQPRGARQRGAARAHAPDHRRLPAPDRAAGGRGRDARVDQPQARGVHADPGAAGDPRFLDLLAARLPTALPALGCGQQADDDALRDALRHPGGQGLRPGIAGARPLSRCQRPPPPLAAVGGKHQHHLRRVDADRVQPRRPDRLVRRRPRRDRRKHDAGPADRLSGLPGDVLRSAGRPLQLHHLADEFPVGEQAGARTARHPGPDRRADVAPAVERRPGGDPLRERHLWLRPQSASASRRVVRGRPRRDDRHRGPFGLRQEHAGEPAVPVPRRSGGLDHGRRARHPHPLHPRPPRTARDRVSGFVSVPGHDLEKPLLRQAAGHDRGGAHRREGRRGPRLPLPPAARLRDPARRARGGALRRGETAAFDRPHAPLRPAGARARRGHEQHRRGSGEGDPGGTRGARAWPDDDRHRAPALHPSQRRPHSRLRPWTAGRAGDACRTPGSRRRLCPARPDSDPGHQAADGRHAAGRAASRTRGHITGYITGGRDPRGRGPRLARSRPRPILDRRPGADRDAVGR